MKVIFLATAIAAIGIHSAHAETYAPWLVQMGMTETVMSAAKWGKGQVFGVVDTGVIRTNPVFAAGQVSSSLSSCAAVSFRCSNGANDDNSHGTAVASIAAANLSNPFRNTISTGAYVIQPGMVIGMAPNANIVAEKVLSAAGSGYSTDVANGIRKAADAGASIINLSLTYGNTPDLVSAVNYAAAKGAFIVWAGGNENRALLNGQGTSGLTAAAIQRLVLVGSVNNANGKSSFSNTAGNGSLRDTGGKTTSYASRWIMATGEGILAPYATAGSNAWNSWSGTSMAAPLVSGSMALLQTAWPILQTRGTTANLLLSTAKDLGSAGTDTTFGTGLVNLATAFQPYGTLMVTLANGTSKPVSGITGTMISSGVLGSLASVKSKLSSYQAFDSYTRNFTVNLSGLIQSPTAKATLNPLPKSTRSGPNVMKLADGAEVATELESTGTFAPGIGFADTKADMPSAPMGYIVMTNKLGDTVALGYGVGAGYSFAKALYDDNDIALIGNTANNFGVSGLAQGGSLMAYGTKIGEDTRFAITWSGTAPAGAGMSEGMTQNATNLGFGLSHRINERFTVGAVCNSLDEKHGLLGSTYETGSLLSFGDDSRTRSITLSLNARADRDNSLQLEISQASAHASSARNLFADIATLKAHSFSMSWLSKNVMQGNDQLTLTAAMPLRLSSGSASMAMSQVDSETGEPVYMTEKVSLVPDGRERQIRLGYSTPLGKHQNLGFQAILVNDSMNIAGNNDSSVGLSFTSKF